MKKFAVAVVLLVAVMFLAACSGGQLDFAAVQKAAEQGDAGAQFQLGLMYLGGHGVPKDDVKAVHWLEKSAAQVHANAQRHLDIAAQKGNESAKRALERLK